MLRVRSAYKNKWSKKKGISTIMGAIILIIIIITFFSSLYAITVKLDFYQQAISEASEDIVERNKEDISVVALYLTGTGIKIELFNEGGVTARIVSLWINDTFYDLMDNDLYVSPGSKLSIQTTFVPEGNKTYIFKIVTERGNLIIDYYPKLVHIGSGNAGVPGGAGAATITPGTWAAGRFKEVTVAIIKNVGTVAFKLNFLTRIVFVDVSTGTVYSGYIESITVGTTTKNIGPTTPSDVESMWIYPGDEASITFRMYEEPIEGTYDIYLHLMGYDAYGSFYTQALYLGRYTLSAP
jgi:archaellum component FlaF (FlaF/FlaG flagellin family)